MVLAKSILILEDDLRTLTAILEGLSVLEDEQSFSFSLTILTDYTQVEKVIGISSVPDFNIQLKKRGVTKVILKEYADLKPFVDELVSTIENMLRKMPLSEEKAYNL